MKRALTMPWLFTSILPLTLASCAGCGGTSAVGTTADAGGDAAADVRIRDASIDRNEPLGDAGSDWSWLPGEWGEVPGIPNFCQARMAKNPARDIPPLAWKACTGAIPGCRQLVVDWHPGPGRRQVANWTPDSFKRLADGRVVMTLARLYPTPDGGSDHTMILVYDLDGSARFGLAEDSRFVPKGEYNRCGSAFSAGDEGISIRTDLFKESISSFGAATWADPYSLKRSREVAFKELNKGAGIQVSNRGTVYMTTQITGGLALFDFATDEPVIPRDGAALAAIESPRTTRDGAVVFRLANRVALDFLKPDGTTTRLAEAQGARHISGFAIDRKANDSLVWVESDTIQPATNTVLWTAPSAETMASLARRRVTAFSDPGGDGGGHMVADGGYALTQVSNKKALLIRLSDGWGWPIDAETDRIFLQPLWVDDNDVWMLTGIPDLVIQDGIMRVSRASLGAPTVPPN